MFLRWFSLLNNQQEQSFTLLKHLVEVVFYQNKNKFSSYNFQTFLQSTSLDLLIFQECFHVFRSLLVIKKSFLANTLRNFGLYSSLFQLSLASILFIVFLLCLCIVRKPAVFDFITCLSFCKQIIVAYRRRAEPLQF